MHVNMKRTTHMKGLNIHHALQKVQCDLSLLKPIICDELAYVSDWTTQDNINLTKVIFALSRQGNKKKKKNHTTISLGITAQSSANDLWPPVL